MKDDSERELIDQLDQVVDGMGVVSTYDAREFHRNTKVACDPSAFDRSLESAMTTNAVMDSGRTIQADLDLSEPVHDVLFAANEDPVRVQTNHDPVRMQIAHDVVHTRVSERLSAVQGNLVHPQTSKAIERHDDSIEAHLVWQRRVTIAIATGKIAKMCELEPYGDRHGCP